MTTLPLFTVHCSPFTVRYPLTVIRYQPEKVLLGPSGPFTGWLRANGKCMACPALNPERSSLQSDYGASRFSAGVNGKWLMVNGTTERGV